jgi:hypothetical protein
MPKEAAGGRLLIDDGIGEKAEEKLRTMMDTAMQLKIALWKLMVVCIMLVVDFVSLNRSLFLSLLFF